MKEEIEGRIKKDLRMQMENRERKRERERERERAHGSRVEGRQGINEQKSKEGASENGKNGGGEGPDTRDGNARERGKEATRERD